MQRIVRECSIASMLAGFVAACASAAPADAERARAAPGGDDTSATVAGLSVERPEGWSFVEPDESVDPRTVIMMVSDGSGEQHRAVVEIEKRDLDARTQRRSPEAILTAWTVEMVQMFAAYEMTQDPTPMELAGHPGAYLEMTISETLPEGGQVERIAKFYGVLDGGTFWIIRALVPPGGQFDGDIEAVLKSVSL